MRPHSSRHAGPTPCCQGAERPSLRPRERATLSQLHVELRNLGRCGRRGKLGGGNAPIVGKPADRCDVYDLVGRGFTHADTRRTVVGASGSTGWPQNGHMLLVVVMFAPAVATPCIRPVPRK